MTNEISIIKTEARTIKGAGETVAFSYRKLGKAAEAWLSADVSPKRKARELAEKAGVSEAMISKGRKIARTFSSDTAIRKACADANVAITIENVTNLCGDSQAPQDTSWAVKGERKGVGFDSKADMEEYIRGVRKGFNSKG